MYDAKSWTFSKIDQKNQNVDMCWRRSRKKIGFNVLYAKWRTTYGQGGKKLPTYNKIGHILDRDCLLKRVAERKGEGKIEGARRRGSRCKQPLYDLKER